MKQTIIWDYNEGMSGVDPSDQMVPYYECQRKTTRWYKNIVLHIFGIFAFNAYCLSSKCGIDKSITLLKFRETTITNLIGDRWREISQNKTNNTSDVYYLTATPLNVTKRSLTGPCQVWFKVKRKETWYGNAVCRWKPPLCVGECFKVYYSKE